MIEYYLTLYGIPKSDPEMAGDRYFYRNGMGEWSLNKSSFIHKIDNLCVNLHDKFAFHIYGSRQKFFEMLTVTPELLYTCGMNSESAVGRDDFERLVNNNSTNVELNKSLYLYDCRKLVGSIQECNKEVIQMLGEFYRVLNLEELYQPKIDEPDGIRYISSPITTQLNALIAFLFIRMHSLLDYLTKLALEASKIRINFKNYPRMSSKNILFSAKKDLHKIDKSGTVFEDCDLITEIETFRNHLIHDGLLDDIPKVYKVNKDGLCTEKYILFPDRGIEGRLAAFKNRNLFYSKEDKINLRLPDIVISFQEKQVNTLEKIGLLL